jgi:hypothetical protein
MADDLKKKLVQYGDKVLFGIFLVVLAATAALTLTSGRGSPETGAWTVGPWKPDAKTVAKLITDVSDDIDQGGVPEGFAAGGFATDPDEINPRRGEKQCEHCGYIVPENVKRCPMCGAWFEDDDDHDGMPNEWEDRYKPTLDRYTPDANKDPDGDGFSNLKEYLGGSDPTDPKSIPSPFRITNQYRKQVDILFQGYTIKEGGSPDAIDPQYWVILLNYGRNTRSKLVPLGGYFRGYRLWPLEKTVVHRTPGHGIPAFDEEVYVLTIQRSGQNAIRLEKSQWAQTNETYVDLLVTRGRDSGKVFREQTIGDVMSANGTQFEITDMRDGTVILKGSEGETYTLY